MCSFLAIRAAFLATASTLLPGGAAPVQSAQSETRPAVAPEHECAFIVVDGRTGEPVAGAEVRWAEETVEIRSDERVFDKMDRHRDRAGRDYDDIQARISASGRMTTSGELGRVLIPVDRSAAWIFVRKDKLLGSSKTVDWQADGPDRVRVWPDGDLRVRVVDAAGQPVRDAGVALVMSSKTLSGMTEQRSLTAADGLATLRHARCTIADGSVPTPHHQNPQWWVAVDMIPETKAPVTASADTFESDPIEIRLTETGEVEVEVRELDGRRAQVQYPIQLREASDRDGRLREVNPRLARPDRLHAVDELASRAIDGRALFRRVGLNRRLTAFAARHEAGLISEQQFAGPTRPGERIRVLLVLGENAVLFTGRAVGPGGEPLAGSELRLEMLNAPSPARGIFTNTSPNEFMTRGQTRFSTDSLGRFTLELNSGFSKEGPPTMIFARLFPDMQTLEARRDVGDRWSIGTHDLGDITFESPPVVAAGTVVNARGEPAPGVIVLSGGSNVRGPIRVRTNDRGEFEVRTLAPFRSFDVCIELPNRKRLESIECRRGATGVVLRMN